MIVPCGIERCRSESGEEQDRLRPVMLGTKRDGQCKPSLSQLMVMPRQTDLQAVLFRSSMSSGCNFITSCIYIEGRGTRRDTAKTQSIYGYTY